MTNPPQQSAEAENESPLHVYQSVFQHVDLPFAVCRSRLSRYLQCFRKRLILNNLASAECDAVHFVKRIAPCNAMAIRHRASSLREALKRRGACDPLSTVDERFFASAHCADDGVDSRDGASPRA